MSVYIIFDTLYLHYRCLILASSIHISPLPGSALSTTSKDQAAAVAKGTFMAFLSPTRKKDITDISE